MLENFTNALVGFGRALEILVGADLLSDFLSLFRGNRLLAGLVKFFNSLLVVAEILLTTDENDGQALAEVKNLRDPLLLDVVERVGRVDSETDEDYM